MCVRISAQLLCTIWHRTVLMIFSLILWTIVIVQISTGEEGGRFTGVLKAGHLVLWLQDSQLVQHSTISV